MNANNEELALTATMLLLRLLPCHRQGAWDQMVDTFVNALRDSGVEDEHIWIQVGKLISRVGDLFEAVLLSGGTVGTA
jgi:hypothetical protein